MIQVKDNGIGMNQDTLNSLFKPFFTTKEQGTGIGLSVCMEIVKANNGNIDVISEEGYGSAFSITLPVK